jgi:FAD/FMN-containing dehydrogenase
MLILRAERARREKVGEPAVVELKAQIRGEVVLPGEERYEEARKVYNAMFDKRPAAVVRSTGVADVIAAVKAARADGLSVAIRGGGHSVPGFGTADGALVVDLGRMRGIRVDPAAQTVRAEGGCTWGDFNHATHAFGLASTGGVVSTTGIAGLTLGGGMGYLSRRAGLSVDNLHSADIVLADGTFVTASDTENPDLFWAIRGGGGNFGVVTNFEYRLHPVRDIVGGAMFFEVDDAEEVMRAYDAYLTNAPRELYVLFAWIMAPPLPFIPEDRHGDTLCGLVVCWSGPPEESDRAFAPLRKVARVAEHTEPMPYPTINTLFDSLNPPGLQQYWKAVLSKDLSDGAIEAHLKHGPRVPGALSSAVIFPINGAVHDIPQGATAFGHRDAKYSVVISGVGRDPKDNETNIGWVRGYYEALAPHSEEGAYVNFVPGDEGDRVQANYGRNFERLQRLKAKFDPGNVFRHNQNISPPG